MLVEPPSRSTPPIPPRPAVSRSRGQAATLHVDLGAELKTAVRAAAQRAGMRPSDWVRSQLAASVAAAEVSDSEAEQGRAAGSDRAQAESTDLFGSPRAHQLTLQPEDIEALDRVVTSGGFRSRPAALRFLLRQHESAQGQAALRELPRSIPALAESNMTLQLAVRMTGAAAAAGGVAVGLDPTLRSDIAAHIERAARVVAALQPLLAPRR